MRSIVALILFMLLAKDAFPQGKTYAFFMIGNYTYPNWEKLEFNRSAKDRGITYSCRKNEKGYKLDVLGATYAGNQKVLIVKTRTANKIYLILADRQKESLLMMNEDGTDKKKFALGYEGPVDGKGTYCDTCANEPDEAFDVVNAFFL